MEKTQDPPSQESDDPHEEVVLGVGTPAEIPTQYPTQTQETMHPTQTQGASQPFIQPFPLAQSQVSQLSMQSQGLPHTPAVARRPFVMNFSLPSQTQASYSTCGFGTIEAMLAAQEESSRAPFVPNLPRDEMPPPNEPFVPEGMTAAPPEKAKRGPNKSTNAKKTRQKRKLPPRTSPVIYGAICSMMKLCHFWTQLKRRCRAARKDGN